MVPDTFAQPLPLCIMSELGFTTSIVHLDRHNEHARGAVHMPMHVCAEYAFTDAHELTAVFQGKPGYTYARQGSPTTTALENRITLMEEGVGTVSFATGMAALSAVFFTLLRAGDHLVSSRHIFGNTNSLLGTLAGLGVDVTLVDATDAAAVAQACRPNTRMVFCETLANPGTQIADLAGIGRLCRERGLVFVLDSTLTTAYLLRGRTVEASLVVTSLSKHVGGHGNALGGAVTDTGLYDWSGYDGIAEPYRKGSAQAWALTQIKKKGLRDMGATLSSESAHRLAAGSETLALRLEKACANALALAQALAVHPRVADVHYPGLATHPQHARAKALFDARYGVLMAIALVPEIDVFAFLNRLQVFVLATHLGDNRSLILPVAHTIYYEMGPQRRAEMGIADNLLRVSVGIEDAHDIIADFVQALDAA